MAGSLHGHNNNNCIKNMGNEPPPLGTKVMVVDKDYISMLPPDSEPHRKWYFSLDYLLKSPSVKNGMSSERELRERQKAASFIQDMGERLNNHHGKDPRPRISQLCLCTAMVHMHRFYVFHSFTMFHAMDIGAACIFLAAKVEECPKKLESIVIQWHRLKYPKEPPLDPKSDKYTEAAQLIVTLENIVLLTLGFDLETQIPHTSIIKGAQIIKAERSMTETAYWFASDILHLTNLCVRYRPSVIACVCIYLATSWANWEPPKLQGDLNWWNCIDPDVDKSLLDGLAQEFVEVMRKTGDKMKMKSNLFVSKKLNERAAHASGSTDTPPPPPLSMPPPPAPPNLPTTASNIGSLGSPKSGLPKGKVDMQAYKERRAASSTSLSSLPEKKSFMPDTNQAALLAAKQAQADKDRKRMDEKRKQHEEREKERARRAAANQQSMAGRPPSSASSGQKRPYPPADGSNGDRKPPTVDHEPPVAKQRRPDPPPASNPPDAPAFKSGHKDRERRDKEYREHSKSRERDSSSSHHPAAHASSKHTHERESNRKSLPAGSNATKLAPPSADRKQSESPSRHSMGAAPARSFASPPTRSGQDADRKPIKLEPQSSRDKSKERERRKHGSSTSSTNYDSEKMRRPPNGMYPDLKPVKSVKKELDDLEEGELDDEEIPALPPAPSIPPPPLPPSPAPLPPPPSMHAI